MAALEQCNTNETIKISNGSKRVVIFLICTHLSSIGDVSRRIVAKAILFSVGEDVMAAAGPLQTCAGHAAGSEAAIHAMRDLFLTADCEAALLVDATNAFNSINREAALHNISIYFVQLCLQFCAIPMVLLLGCSSLVRESYFQLRARHRGIPSLWRCTHWQWFL